MKTNLGEMKLMPVKENGNFVFCNSTITINSKVSKGDKICVMVDSYELVNGKHFVKPGHPLIAKIVIRGEEHDQAHTEGNITIEDYYLKLCEYYKTQFYFGKKSTA